MPSAGYLTVWALEPYHDGMLLRVPDWNDPTRLAEKVDMPKTYEMFAEKTHWDIIMRLSNAGDVNKAILKGHASELIQVSEALQEKKIVQIAEEIRSTVPSRRESCTPRPHHRTFVVRQDHLLQASEHPTAGLWSAPPLVLYRRLFRGASNCWPVVCAPYRSLPTTIS